MASLKDSQATDVLTELRNAVVNLSSRGLVNSAKWMSEQACSLAEIVDAPMTGPPVERHDAAFWQDWDKYCMAKNYFDLKEFKRAAHFFEHCKSDEGKFMKLYSLYLAGEKSKDVPVLAKNAVSKAVNPELAFVRDELASMESNSQLDGYCSYLYGVVLKECSLTSEAIPRLVDAINKEPMLWAAWQLLASLLPSVSAASSHQLPAHWIRDFFEVELHMAKQSEELLHVCTSLQEDIPSLANNAYVNTALAMSHYDLRDFHQCSSIFNELRQKDPCRIDFVDIYSNMLYVNGMEAELSRLAHHCVMVDKYRAETCFVIANYYSMKHDHAKAIAYFQRALKLDRTYISAWTLLGHEFVEQKNVPAAIECYHSATALNPRDYRAWYGLGQTYEVLQLQNFSLYYYAKAQSLRPNDPRMLVAVGDCYSDLHRPEYAKKCFQRAVNCKQSDTSSALYQLAKLHETQSEREQAAHCFIQLIQQHEGGAVAADSNVQEAYTFMAGYHLSTGNLDKGAEYAQRCLMFDETREAGRSLLQEITRIREVQRLKKQRIADTTDL